MAGLPGAMGLLRSLRVSLPVPLRLSASRVRVRRGADSAAGLGRRTLGVAVRPIGTVDTRLGSPIPPMTTLRRSLAIVLVAASVGMAGPYPPYPPYPPPPPPPRYYQPVPVVDPTPPPLSPVMRAIYAPFYVAGLVIRYGVYYTIVAPIEVLSRTVAYGVDGGVERRPPPPPPAPPAEEDRQ
jgi:hypothetical protein